MASTDLDPSIATCVQTANKAQSLLLGPNPRLQTCEDVCKQNGIPPIAIYPSHGAQLQILAQMIKAKNILEIGALGGYSTIWLAESSPDVHVTSLEVNPKHRDVALQNTHSQGLTNVEIRLGAALDLLPELEREGKRFDLVFVDADWNRQAEYFDWAVRLTRSGGAVYVDNVVAQLVEAEREGDPEAWSLIDKVKGDQRVNRTLISTVGTPKTDTSMLIDGYMLAIVK